MDSRASVYCIAMKKLFSSWPWRRARRARCSSSSGAAVALGARRRRLTIDQLIDIRHPSNPVWSPDGRRVAFLSERAGIANIYVADVTRVSGMSARARADALCRRQRRAVFWSADSQRVYFPRQRRSLAGRASSGGEPSAVWTTPQPESSITPSPDGTRVAFVRSASARAAAAPARPRRSRWRRRRRRPDRPHARRRQGIDGRRAATRRSAASSWSPDGAVDRVHRGARHDPPRADAGVLRREDHLHDHRERAGRDDGRRRGRRRADERSARGGGFGGAPLARRDALPRRSHVARLQAADDSSSTSTAASRRCCTKTSRRSSGASPATRRRRAAVARRQVDRVPQRSRRLGSPLRRCRPPAARPIQITKGQVRGVAAAVVARQHAHRVRRERAGSLRRSPARRRDDRTAIRRTRRSPRSPAAAAPNIAPQWSPDGTRLVYQHTDPQNSADLCVVDARSRREAGAADRLDAGGDRSHRRSSSRSSCTTPGPTASRCRRGCSCRRTSIARRSIRRSSGSTATA